MNKKTSKILTCISIGCCALFILLLVLVVTSNISGFDNAIGTIFHRTEFMTTIMKCVTFLGEASSIILIGVLTLVFWKNKNDGLEALLGVGIVAWLNSVIKKFIRRARPSITHLVQAGGYSFPSGHSASSMMFYGFLIYLVNKRCKNKTLKKVLTVILVVIIIAIGVSRIYLGVHYPSDVLAGFLWGLATLIAYIQLIIRIEEKTGDKMK